MANERPSDRPNGYWLASNPATMPAHALPEWLMNALTSGHDFQSQSFPDAPPAFPANAPSQGPTRGYEDSDFASLQPSMNALRPALRLSQPMPAGPTPYNALRWGRG